MAFRVPAAEVNRWQAASLIDPPAPKRSRASPPPRYPVAHHHHDDGGPGWRVVLTLPGVKLVSRSNAREHWSARHKRDRSEATALTLAWVVAGLEGWHPPLPLVVIFTKIGGKLMDDDNLVSSFKAIRDATANLVGVDDGDDRVRWRCKQRRGATPLVRVTLVGSPSRLVPIRPG